MEQYDQEQYFDQSKNGSYPMGDDKGREPSFAGKVIAGIIQLLVWPLYGLVPLVITIAAKSSWKCGDHEAYEKRIKAAKTALMIGWILMVIESVVVLGGFIYLFYAMVTSGF